MEKEILRQLRKFLGVPERILLKQDEKLLIKLENAVAEQDFMEIHHLGYEIEIPANEGV